MKNVIRDVLILVLVFALISGISVFSDEIIDTERPSTLTFHFTHNDVNYEGLQIKTFYIAEVSKYGEYTLSGDFKDYPVNIYGIRTQKEWNDVASTLESYIYADKISPTCTGITNSEGKVNFKGILPGMYLTLSVKTEKSGVITNFHTFLTVVPYPTEDGGYNYDVSAIPKCESHTPTPSEKEYKIVKQWRDEGNTDKRPEKIEIDIYKDLELHSTQILTAENNWCYTFKAPDDGSEWHAVERNISEDYTVTVVNNKYVITITNEYSKDKEDPPQTGESFELAPLVLLTGFSGGLILILAVWSKRKYHE